VISCEYRQIDQHHGLGKIGLVSRGWLADSLVVLVVTNGCLYEGFGPRTLTTIVRRFVSIDYWAFTVVKWLARGL
jgi:hypothetical protein